MTVIALGVYLCIVAAVAYEQAQTFEDPPVLAYYYNLSTGEIFAHDRHALAPLMLSNGQEAVIAIVYACDACDSAIPGSQYIGWIEKYSAGLQDAYNEYGFESESVPHNLVNLGRFVAPPGPQPNWFRAASPQGERIIKHALEFCGDKTPIRCSP